MRDAVRDVVPSVAEMIALSSSDTRVVFKMNVAEVAAAGITTVAGTFTFRLVVEIRIVKPPDGAGPSKVTEPVAAFPPRTACGWIVNRVSVGAGVTIRED